MPRLEFPAHWAAPIAASSHLQHCYYNCAPAFLVGVAARRSRSGHDDEEDAHTAVAVVVAVIDKCY